MPPAIASPDAERIVQELAPLHGRERTRAVRRYADLYGITPASVSRTLRRAGLRTRAVNSRRGTTRVSEDDLLAAANAIARSSTSKDGQSTPLVTVGRAREILARNGHGTLAEVGDSRLATLLRERGLSRRGIRQLRTRPPRVRVKTSHPNQVHVIDATHCVRFFFGGHGLTFRQDLDKTVYKNKPNKVRAIYGPDGKNRIWRLAVIDHCTSAFYVRYYEMPGEHPAATIEFLLAAWRTKGDSRYEFHGVPAVLFSDKGIATLGPASPVRRFAENLGVKVVTHAVGNPAAKGSIEGFMAFWERHFEGPLALQPAFSLAELNAWAFEEAMRLQSTRTHRRHGMTRFEAWRRVADEPGQLRELPQGEDAERRLRDVATYRPVSRKVTPDGVVRFASLEWRVPSSDLHGKHVLVYRDFWKAGAIQVAIEGQEDAERFECAPLGTDGFGFRSDAVPFGTYRRLKDTQQQKNVKAALRHELGEVEVYGRDAAGEEAAPAPIPRRGEVIEAAGAPVRTLARALAKDRLGELLEDRGIFDFTHEDWVFIDRNWGDTVTEDEIEAMADEVVRMRLRQGAAEETGGEEKTA